jgi:hypothetical protein
MKDEVLDAEQHVPEALQLYSILAVIVLVVVLGHDVLQLSDLLSRMNSHCSIAKNRFNFHAGHQCLTDQA